MVVENRIEVKARIEPHYGAITPTLQIRFTIENRMEYDAVFTDLNYELYLQDVRCRYLLGIGTVYKIWGQSGDLNCWKILKEKSDNFCSNLELGISKIGEIERMRQNQLKGAKKLEFRLHLYGNLVRIRKANEHGWETETSHVIFGTELTNIEVTISDWMDWLNHWGENRELIEVSKEVKAQLTLIKEKWHKLDYSDTMYKLLDTSGVLAGFTEIPSERELVRSILGEGEMRPKIESMISNAKKEIYISGWVDTICLDMLRKKVEKDNVTICVLTKTPDGKSPMPTRTASEQLARIASVRRNPLLHARMLIVDGTQVLIMSADITNHSLTQNFEVGFWTNDKSIVTDARDFFIRMFRKSKDKTTK